MNANDVNEVINNLSNKLGVAADLLIPEMAKMHIMQDAFILVVFGLMFIISLIFIPIAVKYDKKQWDTCWGMLPISSAIVSFLIIVCDGIQLMKWIAAPNIMAMETILNLVGGR